jgi:hypothetical protein
MGIGLTRDEYEEEVGEFERRIKELEGKLVSDREVYDISIKAAEAAQHTLWRRITELESRLDSYRAALEGILHMGSDEHGVITEAAKAAQEALRQVPTFYGTPTGRVVETPMLKDGDLVEIEGVVKRLMDVEKPSRIEHMCCEPNCPVCFPSQTY